MDFNIAIFRLGIVVLASLFFGLVRQKMHKPIGFGTFIFVSLGATALSVISVTVQGDNPLVLVGSIVTGIGFLGAGALIRTSDKTSGFTSAASIWLFAIVGVVIGLGEYFLGTILYGMAWVVLAIDSYLEKRSIGAFQKRIVITTNKLIPTSELDRIFSTAHKHKMLGIEVNKGEQKMTITFLIEGTKADINHLAKELVNQAWFASCKVE